jgi:hypothetical protein
MRGDVSIIAAFPSVNDCDAGASMPHRNICMVRRKNSLARLALTS